MKNNFEKLMWPYLIWNWINALWAWLLRDQNPFLETANNVTKFSFDTFEARGYTWYLLALFQWRMISYPLLAMVRPPPTVLGSVFWGL